MQKELKTSNNVYYSNCENFQIDRLTSTLLHPLKNGPYESVDTLRQHWLQLWRSRLVLRNWSILEHSTSKQMWGRKKMAATAAVKLLTHGATVAPTIATLRQFQVGDSAWKSDSIFFSFSWKKKNIRKTTSSVSLKNQKKVCVCSLNFISSVTVCSIHFTSSRLKN